jgi:spore coat protein H
VGAIYALRQQYAYPNHLPVFSNLATRVTLHPALRERLLALVERALEEVFKPATIGARIDALYALVSPAMHAPVEPVPVAGAPADFIDPRRVDLAKFERGPSYLETFVARRIPFLRSQIARIRGWRPTLALEAIDVHEGWVELANRGGAPVSLGGKTLTPWLRRAMLSNLPARTLAPGERLRVRAADVGITLGEKGEVGLFDGLSVTGMLDAAYYGPVPAGKRLVRGGDGVWQVR